MISKSEQILEPVAVVIDLGAQKLSGYIMKLTTTGMLVEIATIPFKVGTYVTATFSLSDDVTLTERMRSIKHYDKYYRRPPKKKLAEGETQVEPKKLLEVHFHDIKEASKVAITKYQIEQRRLALSGHRR